FMVSLLTVISITTILPTSLAHAQIQNETVQQMTQNGVIMQFDYSPSSPIINNYTQLSFNVINTTTGEPLKNYIASVTVGNVVGFTGGSGYYNFSKIAVQNGNFTVRYAFPNDGLFPVYFRADYPTSAYGPGAPIAIGEFKVIVPAPSLFPSDSTMIYIVIGIAAVGVGVAIVVIQKRKSGIPQ
ncbi:MAG: hypothetical protein ACREBB_12030, partial [Nitrosotalea sp.]